ncbi:hypothetical protein CY34DRAFT_373009 [Suillus luteus UH-Slu-Lm8-n1]|uniref:Uncharacterized protein n=1 Tax=Suillus luteus UH-Slu-Lm8-n1 TaxID=930992 RepID=A0A0D0AWI7_9AGAM|nr:hypothetical protein CY34DRAFT_373009 [Suillus luteus UH-Slu-Lm8-n1]
MCLLELYRRITDHHQQALTQRLALLRRRSRMRRNHIEFYSYWCALPKFSELQYAF